MVVVAGHTSPSHIALAHRQRIAGQQASGFAIWHRPGCPERNCEAIIPGEIEPGFPLGGEGLLCAQFKSVSDVGGRMETSPSKRTICPTCGGLMTLARVDPRLGKLPELRTYTCTACPDLRTIIVEAPASRSPNKGL
jgi:hypothetical protein